jgi:4-amino-4-deoxy-L-arabinose transferase-like glycosyltransferase
VKQTSDATTSPPLFPAARILSAVLILATLYLCYFYNLGAIGLVGPDEPRYAWIARDMAETRDWVTPRLYGKPWFEKPPLYYWGAALSFKIFGVSEAAARLPSAVCALLATLAMAWLAWKIYGAETARWVLLLLPTTVGMIGFSHAAATDMPFAAMLTIAMVFAACLLNLIPPSATPRIPASGFFSFTSSTSFTSFFFGVFLGLATLAKGPAAIILSGGAVLVWAAFTKRWRDAFRCLHPLAIFGFCLTALPWYILCAHRNPDFFRIFIIEHNFKRFLTPEFQHMQPFWYYIPILLIALLPWALALLWAIFYGALRYLPARPVSPATFLLLSWSTFCLLFFSLSQSKLPGYILPAVPPVAGVLFRSFTFLSQEGERSFRRFLFAASSLAFAGALGALWFGYTIRSKPAGLASVSAASVLFFFALANILLAGKEYPPSMRSAAPVCVLPILLLVCWFNWIASPWLRYDPSGRTLSEEIQMNHIPADQLYAQSMRRGQQFSLSFYLHREIQTWDPQNPKEGYLLCNTKSCQVPEPWTCSTTPLQPGSSGWFTYRVERSDSASRLGGGASGGRGARGNLNNGQPR